MFVKTRKNMESMAREKPRVAEVKTVVARFALIERTASESI